MLPNKLLCNDGNILCTCCPIQYWSHTGSYLTWRTEFLNFISKVPSPPPRILDEETTHHKPRHERSIDGTPARVFYLNHKSVYVTHCMDHSEILHSFQGKLNSLKRQISLLIFQQSFSPILCFNNTELLVFLYTCRFFMFLCLCSSGPWNFLHLLSA